MFRKFDSDSDDCTEYFADQDHFFNTISRDLQRRDGDETTLNEALDGNNEVARMTFTRVKHTLLHIVAKFGSLKAAERLIQLGANINKQDLFGGTPLFWAIKYRPDMFTFLLKNGAEVNATIQSNGTINYLKAALIWGSVNTVEQVLSKIYPSVENWETLDDVEKCEKPLKHLLKQEIGLSRNFDEQELLDELFARFVSSNSYEFPENDVKKCWKIVEFILKQNIDISLPNDKYPYLLRFVLKYGDEETFKIVLREGKNFELSALGQGLPGIPILHLLIHDNKDEAYLKLLVDHGIDCNVEGNEGFTALHYVVKANNLALVCYFLSLGADPNKRTRYTNYTPLDFAVANGNKNIIEILLDAGADIKAKVGLSSVLSMVCTRSDENRIYNFNKEIMKLLLERGADTEVADFFRGNLLSPLEITCLAGRADLVELLLNYRADLHYNQFRKKTLLHHAVAGGNLNVIDLLIRKDLNINAKDINGYSPLNCMVHLKSPALSTTLIEFLVDCGADVNSQSMEDKTPLSAAMSLNRPEIVECLLELKADFMNESRLLRWRLETDSQKVLAAFIVANSDSIMYLLRYYDLTTMTITRKIRYQKQFFDKYKNEVDYLKNRRICADRSITFHNFLTKDVMKVMLLFDIDNLLEALEGINYKNEFPCYAFLLEKRIERMTHNVMTHSLNSSGDHVLHITDYGSHADHIMKRGNMNHATMGSMHAMSMVFHGGFSETILFDFWKTSSLGGLVGSIIGIIVLAALYEGLKYYREYLFWKMYNTLQYKSDSTSRAKNVVHPTMFSWMHMLQTSLHIIQMIVSYFLMLIFMTYNVWLCLAVIMGAVIGYFLFGWKKSVIVDVTEHCH